MNTLQERVEHKLFTLSEQQSDYDPEEISFLVSLYPIAKLTDSIKTLWGDRMTPRGQGLFNLSQLAEGVEIAMQLLDPANPEMNRQGLEQLEVSLGVDLAKPIERLFAVMTTVLRTFVELERDAENGYARSLSPSGFRDEFTTQLKEQLNISH